MENSQKPAFSVSLKDNGNALHSEAMGLTKREYFALHIMTGLCVQAIPGQHNTCENQKRELVPHAIQLADALLKELEK